MSTKFSHLFVDTDVFTMHLYDDIKTGSNLFIRVNNSEVTIPLGKDELDDINAQIKSDDCKDLSKIAHAHVKVIRCKACGHLKSDGYCCWTCGDTIQ